MASQSSEESLLEVLNDIRNWIRAAAYDPVRRRLEAALPDEKARSAYQMFDGKNSIEQVRVACKMSPNAVIAFANRCEAMGLMKVNQDKKRIRLFDLNELGLIAPNPIDRSGGK